MKNPKKSSQRRIKRGHAVILWDNVHKSLYLADVPKRGRKDFLLKNSASADMAKQVLSSGRPYTGVTPEYAK